MSISGRRSEALYYPFHLCSERTLLRALERYDVVHFRDYMALQLTPTSGTTAYADRMGQFYEQLVRDGRIVQGHAVSGPLDAGMAAAIDRDLADPAWRSLFHEALRTDRRFQRGLFDLTHVMRIGGRLLPGPAVLLELLSEERRERPFDVATVRRLSAAGGGLAEAYDYEYGMALVTTAASLGYTVRLCRTHRLAAVTDSAFHYRLLERSREREGLELSNEDLWETSEVRP